MSRPDQSGTPASRQPPLSFKTVPGRNRTQKWNEAKSPNYDGDDWGGFDPYDEYAGHDGTESDEHNPPLPSIARQQSFDVGSERRQFSAPSYPAERRASPAMSSSSGQASDHGRRARDPADPPPSLQSSLAQSSAPPKVLTRKASANSVSSTSSSKSPDKPLPFIRPSDIYKRMAEEKEKERLSMDSSRPSMESLQREGTPSNSQRPLSTVQERPGSTDISTLLDTHVASMQSEESGPQSRTYNPLPKHTVPSAPSPEVRPSIGTNLIPDRSEDHQLSSLVQDAFYRDPDASVSNYSDNNVVSRSNTDSTSAISPIMSRIPSAAAANERYTNFQSPVSSIAEEPNTAASHSRNVSAETMIPSKFHQTAAASHHQRSFSPALPSPNNSPARTPDLSTVEPRRLSGPLTAEIAADQSPAVLTHDGHPTEMIADHQPLQNVDYSAREADLAQEARNVTETSSQADDIGSKEQSMQSNFLSDRAIDGGPLKREWSFDASPGLSQRGSEEILSVPRPPPAPERLNSFQPQLPGQWVSATPTPAIEERGPVLSMPVAEDQSKLETRPHPLSNALDPPDLSATPKHSPVEAQDNFALSAVKNAGAALGAAFLSTAGTNHQNRDFAASSRTNETETAPSQLRGSSGEVYPSHPPFNRQMSTAISESNASFTSDRPPTPPAKDESLNPQPPTTTARSMGVQPATTTADNSAHPHDEPSHIRRRSTSSAESIATDFESDRLRRDIVRSLDMSKDAAARDAHLVEPGTTATKDHVPNPGPSATTRTGFLDQRFSWEAQADPSQATTATPIAIVGELPGDEDRQSYERPDDGQHLHVVNAPREELQSPIVSPIEPAEQRRAVDTFQPSMDTLGVPGTAAADRDQLSPSPISFNESTGIPSYYAGLHEDRLDSVAPQPIESQPSSPVTAPSGQHEASPIAQAEQQQKRQSGRIPPFREILALRTPPERIQAYHDTRQTFATMDTGLQDWLTTIFTEHPEHNHLKSARPNESVFTDSTRGNKYNPGLLKMKQRGSGHDGGDRKLFPNVSRTSEGGPATPPKDISEASRQQMEKMQAKGKDIMKTAGVLGGKAQAGAKGLFAKGKSRFARGDKVE